MANDSVLDLYQIYLTNFIFQAPERLLVYLHQRADREVLEQIWDRMWENVGEWAKVDPDFAATFSKDTPMPDISILHFDSEDRNIGSLYVFIYPYHFEEDNYNSPLYFAF